MERRILPEASSKSFLSSGDELGLRGRRLTVKAMLPEASANARTPRGTPACFLEPNRSIGICQSPDPGYAGSEVSNSIFAFQFFSLPTPAFRVIIIKNYFFLE